jgi:xylose isomerase
VFENFIEHRYRSFKEGIGLEIVSGKANFHTLEQYALQNRPIQLESGRLELLKATLNQYLLNC